jgi:hypothetical protein
MSYIMHDNEVRVTEFHAGPGTPATRRTQKLSLASSSPLRNVQSLIAAKRENDHPEDVLSIYQLTVCYSQLERRIISARRSNRRERKAYREAVAQA